MAKWSVAGDLMSATATSSPEDALRKLGFADGGPLSIRQTTGWYRSGAETYSLRFEIRTSHSVAGHFIAKACVAEGNFEGVGGVADEWMKRRLLLMQEDVATPRLLCLYRATVFEEFVPHTFGEALLAATGHQRIALSANLGRALGSIARLGFLGLSFSDLRSRGTDVVIVDFGEDLGPPGVVTTTLWHLADEALADYELDGQRFTAAELRAFARAFDLAASSRQ